MLAPKCFADGLQDGHLHGDMPMKESVSIVIPAYNEEAVVGGLVQEIRELLPEAEVLVVDDGSGDATAKMAADAGATVVRHPYNKGNGAAARTGIRHATGDIVVMMDGDGQHSPKDIPQMLELFPDYDMVVGARGMKNQAGLSRGFGNCILNKLAGYLTSFPIQDLTSGFRSFKREMILPYLHLFPMGFSYPTTSTLAMLKAGANVCYVPAHVRGRQKGKSKILFMKDGSRFFIIILKLVTLFSPMRIFLPIATFFGALGITYSMITLAHGHFTNMAALLLIVAVFVFLLGLIAEQLTAIHMQGRK